MHSFAPVPEPGDYFKEFSAGDTVKWKQKHRSFFVYRQRKYDLMTKKMLEYIQNSWKSFLLYKNWDFHALKNPPKTSYNIM